MDLHHVPFRTVDLIQLEASQEECDAIVRKDCNNFLKTKQGFHYLMMKYPHLSVPQAINEYIKNALWIDNIV
jgi:hypothetical protein